MEEEIKTFKDLRREVTDNLMWEVRRLLLLDMLSSMSSNSRLIRGLRAKFEWELPIGTY